MKLEAAPNDPARFSRLRPRISRDAAAAAARAYAPGIAQALDAGDAAWSRRQEQREARKSYVEPRPAAPPAPSAPELVRQYWRFAAMCYPDGIPPGFEAHERPVGL